VLSISSRPLIAAALIGVAVLPTGCQHYEPRPLDLESHHLAWSARTPGDESIRALADRLAETGDGGVFDPTDGLTLEEAEVVALVYNPDLRLQRLRAGIVAARAGEAGRWADPEFSFDLLRVTQGVPSPWVITPGLALTIPISGRLEAEKAKAGAALRVALTEIAEQEWATRLDLRAAWLRWSSALVRGEQASRLLASLEPLAAAAARLANAGEMPATTTGLFDLERALQRQAVRRATADAEAWMLRVRQCMGLSPNAPIQCVPTLQAAPAARTGVDRVETLTLQRLRAQYEVAEQTLLLEIRKQYPDLVLGPLYERDQGQSRIGLFGAIPIPILNANVKGIAEARAARELARAAYETEYERLAGHFQNVQARQRAAAAGLRTLEEDIVPIVERQVATARRMVELGEVGIDVLLESLIREGEICGELIEARLQAALVGVDLARLTTAAHAPHPALPVIQSDGGPAPHSVIPTQEVVP
jgi:hypothetical protein